MSKIPTAEEILIKERILLKTIEESGNFPLNLTRDTHIGTAKDIKKAMIEFAKLHVEACKKEYLQKAFGRYMNHAFDKNPTRVPIEEDSILNAYPLTNIK